MKITLHSRSIVRTVFLLLLVSVSYYSFTNGTGAPAGNTAAPGDGNCTSCHFGSLITSGPDWNNVSITSTIPSGGYTPGSSYTITVSHTMASINKFGFEFISLTGSAAMAGSLTAGTGSQAMSIGPKTYLTHTAGGTAGSGSKSWSFTWTAPSAGTGNVTFYTTINAANGDNNTTGDQIFAKNLTVPEFSNLPTATITGIPTGNIACVGDTLHLQGSGNGSPTGYSWSITGVPTSTLQNVTVIFTSAGQKTISLTTSNSFGSSTPNSQSVTVVAKPAATISPAGSVNICGNDSVTLNANFNASFTYLWSPGNETSSSIKSVTPGIHKVKVTNSLTGCSATSANVTLVQKTKPTATLTLSSDTVCSADSLTLFSNTPFNNYRFFDQSIQLQTGTSTSYKNLFASGPRQLGLVVTDANGCNSDTARKTAFVQPKLDAPVLSCGAKTSSTVEFTWAAVPGASGYEVSTDTGQSWITVPNGTLAYTIGGLSPNSNAELLVRAIDPSLCSRGNTGTLICTNGACTPVTFAFSRINDNNVCLSSAQDTGHILITLSNISAPSYGIQYGNEPYTSSLTYNAPVLPGTNMLHIKVKDSSNIGCPPADTVVTLTGNNPISANPVLAVQGALCKGGNMSPQHILAIQNPATGAHVFKLFRNNDITPFATVSPAAPQYSQPAGSSPLQDGDSLYAIATDTVLGCSKQSEKIKIAVHQAPNVGFSITTNFLDVTLTDTTSNAASRNWNYNGSFPDQPNGSQTVNKTYPQHGTFQVTMEGTDLNGCMNSVSESFTLINSGLADLGSFRKANLYPNPVKDILEITVDNPGTMQVFIYDMQGRLARQEEMPASGKMDLSELRNGLYSMYVKQGETLYNGKFIKE